MTPAETLTLVAYFFVLIILAVYGWHRYYLVYLYTKNRDKGPKVGPPLDRVPIVTIQLPLFNEMYVADRPIDAVAGIEYPPERPATPPLDYSLLTKIQSILLDGHFVLEHGARNRSGRFFSFNGTAGVWRRAAIDDAGGWQHDTLTEDLDLSYRAQLRGWRFVFVSDLIAPAEVPVEMNGFKSQQHRWAKGSIQTCRKLLPTILRADIPLGVKAEALFHLTAIFNYALVCV